MEAAFKQVPKNTVMNPIKIGFAREIYSPDTPQTQNGVRMGYSVLTDVMVTCVALSDGEETALIFSNDIRNLADEFTETFRRITAEETGVKADNIMICATHNHSAPDPHYYHKREETTDWLERIAFPAIRRAAKGAVADLSPVVKVTRGTSLVDHVTFVRRYFREDGMFSSIMGDAYSPSKPARHETEADRELRALRFYREGKKDVVLTNFQVHAATALGATPDVICSDFLHEFRKTVEDSGELQVMYLQGGCGNLNTYSRVDPDACNTDYDRVGRLIGEGTLRALETAEEIAFDGFSVQKEYYTGNVNHTRDHLVEKARETREIYRKNGYDRAGGAELMRQAGFDSEHECAQIIAKSQMPKTRQIPLCTICFGEVGLTFAPFEMFDTNCRQIRDASPFDFTMTVGYCNGRHHYLPSAYSFSNKGYEPLQCFYIPGTGETVALEFLRLLKQAYGKLK